MRPELALEQLAGARAAVQQALAQFDAPDVARIDSAAALFEQSLYSLRQFSEAVRQGDVVITPDLHASVSALKQDIARGTRLADAGSAFCRGLAARLGHQGSSYDSAGRLADNSDGVERDVLC